MKVTPTIFGKVLGDLSSGKPVAMVADHYKLNEKTVRYIKQAGTWERWPYYQARKRFGYNTPEYKAYLKRRGLPLTVPPKPAQTRVGYLADKKMHGIEVTKPVPAQPLTLWGRFTAWMRSLFS